MKKKMIKWLAICFVFLAWTDCAQGETMASGDDFVQEQLIGQMDFEGIQQMLDQALGKGEFSFADAVKKNTKREPGSFKRGVAGISAGPFF